MATPVNMPGKHTRHKSPLLNKELMAAERGTVSLFPISFSCFSLDNPFQFSHLQHFFQILKDFNWDAVDCQELSTKSRYAVGQTDNFHTFKDWSDIRENIKLCRGRRQDKLISLKQSPNSRLHKSNVL